jgi:glutaredoxin
MTIELYKSALCPRCAYAYKILKDLQKTDKTLTIKTYDIVTNLKDFKTAGISMIPTIKIKEKQKSWVLPKADEIKAFTLQH